MKLFFKLLYYLLVVLRLLTFKLFVVSPLLAWVFTYFLDLFDYSAAIRSGISFIKYEWIDKSTDFVTRVYMVYTAYILGWPYAILLLMVFYRLIGDVLLAVTKNRKYLFIFPNLIEFFFPLYYFYIRFNLDWPYLAIFLFASVILKIAHEYLLHVKNWIDPVSLKYLQAHKGHNRKLD